MRADKNPGDLRLGINGLGRIGKLTLWHHIARKHFHEIVVNIGRNAGGSLEDVARYIEKDSTYGSLHGYLYGHGGKRVITDLVERTGEMRIDGVKVNVLRTARNPRDIHWGEQGVKLVVETTGQFRDPTISPDGAKGTLRGHLEAGAQKVVLSAPFKIKEKGQSMPEDVATTVMGVNENDYDPRKHRIVSCASCTTTCLAHMIKPLIDHFGPKRIMTASMATVHAVTGSQEVLDRLPKAGASDLRKNRSVLNNIILTTTGAADTLGLVIPEMRQIGFMAESVRIPTTTGSLIILVVNLLENPGGEPIRRSTVNEVYKESSKSDLHGYLHYTDEQNVSCDVIGLPRAAAIVEGHETHTRTAEVSIELRDVAELRQGAPNGPGGTVAKIAITQAVIYGWYDNEMGSYVNIMGDRTVSMAETM